MKKLLSLLLLLAFLFGGANEGCKVIINYKGLAQVIKLPDIPTSVNVTSVASAAVVATSCNSPPATA